MLAPDGQVHDVASGPDIKYPSKVVPVQGRAYIANFNNEKRTPPFIIAGMPALR